MPDILLDVPFVAQVNIGGQIGAGLGRTENMICCTRQPACSATSARRDRGLVCPRNTSSPTASRRGWRPKGTSSRSEWAQNYLTLVENEGLTMVPLPTDKKWRGQRQ